MSDVVNCIQEAAPSNADSATPRATQDSVQIPTLPPTNFVMRAPAGLYWTCIN